MAHLPYLGDVACLELAMRESYHAADSTAIYPTALSDPDLMSLHVHLAPSATILRSRFPIFSIWQANMVQGAPAPAARAEAVIVLPPGAATFLTSLAKGPFSYALAEATQAVPEFDLAQTLGLLLEGQAITDLTKDLP